MNQCDLKVVAGSPLVKLKIAQISNLPSGDISDSGQPLPSRKPGDERHTGHSYA